MFLRTHRTALAVMASLFLGTGCSALFGSVRTGTVGPVPRDGNWHDAYINQSGFDETLGLENVGTSPVDARAVLVVEPEKICRYSEYARNNPNPQTLAFHGSRWELRLVNGCKLQVRSSIAPAQINLSVSRLETPSEPRDQ